MTDRDEQTKRVRGRLEYGRMKVDDYELDLHIAAEAILAEKGQGEGYTASAYVTAYTEAARRHSRRGGDA